MSHGLLVYSVGMRIPRLRGAMGCFEHYMYVLECGDGSLYTGYTTNVTSRVAAHQAGRGARYTASHEPVRLVAQARFYTKERAMSAEAHFKRLSREQKQELLAHAAQPLEDVLRAELPGFGEDTAREFVCRNLAQNVDPAYRDFQLGLMPTVDARRMVGVRTPTLRKIAKGLAQRPDAGDFLAALPHRLFEEDQVHAFAIGQTKGYDAVLKRCQDFLPHVNNWATCDQLSTKTLGERPTETLVQVKGWLASGKCYPMRFAIRVLMELFLSERFESRFLDLVAQAHLGECTATPAPASDDYYLRMMRAWYFAEALVKRETEVLPYFERGGGNVPLDEWTRRKAIQKACESLRVSLELKSRLKALR